MFSKKKFTSLTRFSLLSYYQSKKNINDEQKQSMHWSHFAKNKKFKIFVVTKRTLNSKKNKCQFRHRRICRKYFRSNTNLFNVFFVWKTKICQFLIVWRISRIVTISKNTFIASIFVIILTIIQFFVLIFDATWFWTTQCIYKIMSKWYIKHAFDFSKIFMNNFFDDVLIALTRWFFCHILNFFFIHYYQSSLALTFSIQYFKFIVREAISNHVKRQ